MSIKNRIIPFLILGALIAFAGCTKKLNTNAHDPNGTGIDQLSGKDVFAGALTAAIINKSGFNLYNATDNNDYANEWMQYFARANGWSASGGQAQIEEFNLENSAGDGIWGSVYHNIYDFNFVITNSSKNSILPGAARVMRVMLFQELVDQFGNIPYSKAVQPTVALTPTYDSAAAIYKDLIPQLDTALAAIAASQSTADDASDVMFKGDKTLWSKFANTIKLRVLLRQIPHGDQNYVASAIANIVQQGSGFLGTGQDALVQPGFADVPTKQNPFWNAYGVGSQNNNSFCASSVFVAFMDSINDPRVGYYFATNSQSSYGGEPLGNNIAVAPQYSSAFGPGLLKSAAQPGLLFSAATSLFMQAEAVQRGFLSGSAATLYQQGVEASFTFLGSTSAAADSYLSGSTNGLVNFAASTNPLQTILYQKWIAECSLDGLEAYSDYRRTGYPFIAVPSYGATGSPMPQRLLYPESEYTQNTVNVNAQNQSANDIFTPIFWAQ
jgi:hypothetical protein